jgi:hypothetical protein
MPIGRQNRVSNPLLENFRQSSVAVSILSQRAPAQSFGCEVIVGTLTLVRFESSPIENIRNPLNL